ncbi:SusC/RagA family TonB-linked outer membrane protein [Mariniphaga sediminis]|uniref:SusC/RagA family TonB-linked outer membrane protein n=2 Tax=Mariniphaga sediminis TaxID=1628158 RepID=A0A399D0C4_9BACT|nr:SusC/RagA family TonB-linked outer membrane protein [Mariniphaga sediminis]
MKKDLMFYVRVKIICFVQKIGLKMKLTLLLSLVGILNLVASESYSQLARLTISLKDATVEQVLTEIKGNSEFDFVYNRDAIDLTRKVDANYREEKVDNILDDLFKNTNVKYYIIDRVIVLSTVSGIVVSEAQPAKVSGKVTDSGGQPLPGVTVVVKGTTQGTVTNADGEYALTDIPENGILVFSFIGMKSQELIVGNHTTINVRMEEETVGIDEVVVTALGLKRDKKALGYSVGEVKGSELTETSQGNILNAMAGKVSGVKINQMDGTSGSTVNIVIRGATSLNNDNQPLFVVDGIPVQNQLNNLFQGADLGNAISDLSPDDIESVSVLKGASAAALYGSRAGNGVILITTRSGNKGKQGLGISFNTTNTFEIPYNFVSVQNKFGSGNDGAHRLQQEENPSWGPQLDAGENWVQWNSNGEEIPLVSYPDRFKDFFNTGFTTTNNLAIDGNYQKGYFRLSVGDLRNTGVIPNTDLNRSSINLNLGYKITNSFTITTNFNWSESGSGNRPNIDGDDRNAVVRSLYEWGAEVNILDLKDYWVKGQEGIQQLKYKGKQNNPWFIAHENTQSFKRDRLTTKVQFDWELAKELNLMARFTRDGYTEGRESKKAFSTMGQETGGYNVSDIYRKETNFEISLNYKKDLGDSWNLDAFIASNRMYSYYKAIENDAAQLVIPGLYTISNGVPGSVTYNSFWSEKAIYSLYGMTSLGFKDMVYLDLTARNDWSSTLPIDNRSYFYPSASLSMLISEMITMPKWLTFLKLRGGIAQVGNDTEPYRLYQYFSTGEDWGTAKQIFMGGTLRNSNLVPEKATSMEVGADLYFLKNRLGLETTYYIVQNRNQVLSISLPVESGATSKMINTGLIESKGWEIGLKTTPVIAGKFRWDMNLNFTQNRTKIKELADGLTHFEFASVDGAMLRTYEGGYIGDIFEQPMLRVKDESSPYYGYPLLTSNGRYQNDNDPNNIVKIGNANPDFAIGIQPSFSYKSFSLYANIDWSQGGEFYSRTMMFFNHNGVLDNTFSGIAYDPNRSIEEQIKENPEAFFGEWVGGRTTEYGGFPWPSDNNRLQDASFNVGVREIVQNGEKIYVENFGGEGTQWQTPMRANRYANRPFPSRNLYDATYIKLREIALTYRFPKSVNEKIHIQNSSVSFIATNMFQWNAAGLDIDPERAYRARRGVWNQGVEYYNVMPWIGTLGIKLNVEF